MLTSTTSHLTTTRLPSLDTCHPLHYLQPKQQLLPQLPPPPPPTRQRALKITKQQQQQQHQLQAAFYQTISRATSNLHQPVQHIYSNIATMQQHQQQQANHNNLYSLSSQQQTTSNILIKQLQLSNSSSIAHHHHKHQTNQMMQAPSYYYPQEAQYQMPLEKQQQYLMPAPQVMLDPRQTLVNRPLCRCRVMYLGSSVPHITKNGLHGIQEPLRLLYPAEQFTASAITSTNATNTNNSNQRKQFPTSNTIDISHLSSTLGIDSWLSVWSNGLLLENVDEFGREIKRFFSIESLHYCAAVRFFDTSTLAGNKQTDESSAASNLEQDLNNNNNNNNTQEDSGVDASSKRSTSQRQEVVRFLPLDAPLFQCPGMIDPKHPPVFASIMRRTTGIKVLECHAFICRRDAASNALVRCCTQAYADLLNAKRLSAELSAATTLHRSRRESRLMSTNNNSDSRIRSSRALSVGASRKNSSSYEHSERSNNEDELSTSSTSDAISDQNNNSNNFSGSSTIRDVDNNSLKRDGSREANEYAVINTITSSGGTISSSSRRARPKERGSSKSLYNDFMPKSSSSTCCPQSDHSGQIINQLSHSLDLLQASDRLPHAGDQSSGCCEGDICYSVVKSKRHSRSMQELEGPFEFSVPSMRRSSRGSRRRREMTSGAGTSTSMSRPKSSHRYHQQSSSSSSSGGHKKAQSYQDMRRKMSLSSFVNQSQQEERLAQNELVVDESHYEKVSSSTMNTTPTTSDRLKRPKSSRSRKRETPQHSHRRHQPEAEAIPSDATQYHHSMSSYHHGGLPAAHYPTPMAHQSGYPLNYLNPNYYVTGYPPPTMMPGPHYPPTPFYDPLNPYPHPHQYLQAAAAAAAMASSHPFAAGQYILPSGPPPPQAYNTICARKSRHDLSKQTLASRFRCLSPPLKFIHPASNSNLQPEASSARLTSQPEVARDSLQESVLSEQSSTDCQLSNIVSSEPAFASQSTISRNPNKSTKMSWIKRLSLTMSTSSERPVDLAPSAGHESDSGTLTQNSRKLSINPSGQQQQVERRKKRSSIFSGSLTLGRSSAKRESQKQQQQQPLSQPILSDN